MHKGCHVFIDLGEFLVYESVGLFGCGVFPVGDVFLFFLMITYIDVFITLDFDKESETCQCKSIVCSPVLGEEVPFCLGPSSKNIFNMMIVYPIYGLLCHLCSSKKDFFSKNSSLYQLK